ncbi:hypothetical protein [Pseudomonas sp.]|uniref:hypothetical protein n=1 Tax=Pseudomonas sp. TaxID=306 RepID=UPI002586E839|nr:hypothetical protein [Pseudomonas sp.]
MADNITPVPEWTPIPGWDDRTRNSGVEMNKQGQALANRVELLKQRVEKAILTYPDYAKASAAAATLPDGQVVDVEDEKKRYRVEAGALVFVANLDQLKQDLAATSGAGLVSTVDGRTVQQRLDALPSEVDAAGTAQTLVDTHIFSPDPHPQLTTSINDAVLAAEAARDAAQLSAGVYVDTSAGLAATTNGKYFSVPSADINEYLILYKNNSGVALEVKRYPSSTAVVATKDLALYPFVPGKLRVIDLVAGSYQRAITSITNPDTRYDIAINSSTLTIDIRQASFLIAGIRLGSVRRVPGRTYTVQGSFDAGGTALTSNSAIGLAFDPSISAGANMLWDAAASGWFWRQNGSITAYQLLPAGSATVEPSIPFSLVSGAVPTFVTGDVLKLELVESTTGATSILKGYKNGVLAFSGTVANIPAGRLCAVVRGAGGGGAYPSAQRLIFDEVSVTDRAIPEPVIAGSAVTVSTSPVAIAMESSNRLQALLNIKAVYTAPTDFNGQLKRTIPSGFEWMPILPSAVSAGHVVPDKSMTLALLQAYPEVLLGTIAYVEVWGNNTNAVVGNNAKPYQTLNAALQSSARIILVGDGVFTPPDYRFTQAAAGAMKFIIAKNRRKVTLRNAGDTLSANTWTATVGYAGVYETPIASAAGGGTWNAFRPHRIRLTDTVDSEGFAARLRWYKPATNDGPGVTAALVALQAAGTGWTYDGTAKKLYVALGGANVNSNKSRLEALYLDTAGNDRVWISGASLAFDGVDMDGQMIWMQEHNNSGTYIPAAVWAANSRMFNSSGYGVQGDSNTTAILENVHIHAAEADGINPDSTRSGSGAAAKALLINPRITDCGDVDTFGTGVTKNRQAISSHSGYFAAYGGSYEHNWGQEIADTGSGAGPSKSWYVGAVARRGDTRLAPSNVGFGFYDPNRQAWLDTCVALGEGTSPLRLEGGASVKMFNCNFDAAPSFVAPSVAPTAYTPEAP